ncbi:HAMP domain-containing protein [Anaerobacillus alkaliphilus]|uniref:histidine kinase n=1 Tax=Anaerobacillus alkaliphilus TaxID=1548597 RepID=A0A4Q0VV76_9BACI|nr:ATP-binding protein [Anaerobacillus alkaliphilus]RXJ01919.1 HAMP domain-containing protein [Anaerobacillus alkaliphilus]
MKKKLSKKIALFVILILLIVISSMVFFSYHLFKNFYKEQLALDVYGELRTYTAMIEKGIDEELISYLVAEKHLKRHVYMVFFDEDLQPIYLSHNVSSEWIQEYQNWIRERHSSGDSTLQYVDTGIDFHIPHIWAYQPIENGFFFIDQDTGEFEKAKVQLFLLLFVMGLFTLLVGVLLTIYLTNIISKPLIKIGATTRKIAKGDFDSKLSIESDDEVGQLARDIHAMTNQLREYRDSRRQFISHISHDLRTPITYIKGYSAVMKDLPTFDEKEWRQNIDIIYKEATRMESLVSDLFQLTKLEEGKITLYKEEVDVLEWLESIIATRQLMLDSHEITCEVRGDQREIKAHLDQQRLGQAIINLLENSIRYTTKGGSIFINVTEEQNEIIIEIKDNGIGIGPEDLPHVWERFYRVDKSRSRESGGSGLGLAIVKEIVEVHGGRVEVQSQEGVGTSFYVILPKEEEPV